LTVVKDRALPAINWQDEPRDLAAIYRAYDAVLGLVDPWFTVSERVSVWPTPLAIDPVSLHASFVRVVGEPLPAALDLSPWLTEAGWSRLPESVRLPHPVFESLESVDEDEVGRAAHDALAGLLTTDSKLAAVLNPESAVEEEQRKSALDRLVQTALATAAKRARNPRLEAMDQRLAPPRPARPVSVLPDIDAELWFLGALYGAVDGIASGAEQHVSTLGEWEAALVGDVERTFQRALPISTFTGSEIDWMADPFDPASPLGRQRHKRDPQAPAPRPVSFDDDDEPSRGPYNTDAYEQLLRIAETIIDEQFEEGWEAYSDAGGEDPEGFPAERVIRRAVGLVVHAMVRSCREASAASSERDQNPQAE
jgi:hypothetical protein